MHDVFISYKSENYAEAVWVKKILNENGISSWMAPESIPGGSSYADEIDGAIKACKAFVLILSQSVLTSIWVKKEMDIALNNGKIILPFMIENFQLEKAFNFYLTDIQRYKAYSNKSNAILEMIKRIKDIVSTDDIDADIHIPMPFEAQNMIARVVTIGSNDSQNPWPRGVYSSSISLRRFSVVYFHVFLKAPIGEKRKISFEVKVYDGLENLVSDLSSEFVAMSNHDKFSKGIIIKGNDGTSLPSGRYFADISIDGCNKIRYVFQLVD